MVTTQLAELTARLVARPTLSPDVEELIQRYAAPDAEGDRQQFELSLVVANSVLVVVLTGLCALLGWAIAGRVGTHSLAGVYTGAVAVAFTGVALHLCRYYDALIGKLGRRRRPHGRWPRRSGDLDFAVQLAVGVAVWTLVSRH